MNKTKAHQEKPVIRWMIALSAVLTLCTLIFPFGSYRYNKVYYDITGIELLKGRSIAGGSIVIPPTAVLILGVAAAVVTIVFVIVGYNKTSPGKAGLVTLICAYLETASAVGIVVTLTSSILSEASKASMRYGVYLYLACGLLGVTFSYAMLRINRKCSVLDFMVIPGIIYLIINNYLPMLGISFAFKQIDYSVGIWKSPWIGLENFEFLFQSSHTLVILRNTILYNLAFIVLGNLLGIIVGICLNEIFSRKLQKLYQTTILLPQLISWVIVAYIAYGLLSFETGWINKTILGSGNEINFYGEPKYWPFILIFFNLWKGLGYNSIIYLSSIVGIDRNVYEAASIDGCSKMNAIRYITIPLLKPTVFTLVTLSVGRIFYSDFGLFFQVPMNAGALYNVTDTIDTYVYRALMQLNNVGMASAASVFQAIVGFIMVMVFNTIVRKVSRENALF